MSRDTFHKLEISDNRIKSYKQAGLIKEVSVPDKNGNGAKTFYELTDKKGKDFCRQECGIKHFVKTPYFSETYTFDNANTWMTASI